MPAELELTPEDVLAEEPEEALDAPPSAVVIRYKWLRWLLERWGTEPPGQRVSQLHEIAERRSSMRTSPDE